MRVRSSEFVELLLEKKAKINAVNRKGDTALHLAMRARSKKVVEVLLRLPKNNRLLYKPNDQVGLLMSVRLWNFKDGPKMQDFCPRINMLKGFFK